MDVQRDTPIRPEATTIRLPIAIRPKGPSRHEPRGFATRHPPGRGLGAIRWASGIFVALTMGLVVFSLGAVVPKLQVAWKAAGVRIPAYLMPLIVLSNNLPWVITGALVLVWLAARRRDGQQGQGRPPVVESRWA